MKLAGAEVCVLGLARSGVAAARALLEEGAGVRVLDAADADEQRARAASLPGADAILGRTDPADVRGDLVVASPGVPWDSPWLAAARDAGIPVWSEVELAFRLGVEPAIGVTGTNGKTTTVEMTVAALTAAGLPAVAAGNVGTPLVEMRGRAERIVAELSSFQLQAIDAFRAPVAVLLNVAHDHIDWHGSFEAYARAKARIFENQAAGDTAFVHADPVSQSLAEGIAARVVPFFEGGRPLGGAGVEDGWIVVPQGRVMEIERLIARARPHRADAVAAAAAACALGADPEAVGEALAAYRPRPHRIEVIAEVDGVTYINDSKATDPHATLAALEDLHDVVLIAGGRNRSRDLDALGEASWAVRAVVALGEAAADIEAVFRAEGVPVEHAASIEDAVERARAIAGRGDTVLLSPACASLDMFINYEARGEAFRAAVKRLEGGTA